MPLTPETWLAPFTVNSTTTFSQFDPHILQLTNGNILVSWTSTATTGVASRPGTDVIGQIFDPLGNPVGGEILLNENFSVDDERNMDIAALPNGGFVSVFEDENGGAISLRINTYDATGAVVDTNGFLQADPADPANPVRNPSIAASSDTSVMIVYEFDFSATDTDIRANIYDPTTNTFGPAITIFSNVSNETDPVVTALSNGNYVIVVTDDSPATGTSIKFEIRSSTGTLVKGDTNVGDTATDTDFDTDPHVTALTGGGFVITWTNIDANDTDVLFQVFDATGASVSSVLSANGSSSTDDSNEPNVVALSDGGFLILYDDDRTGDVAGRGQRYDATGVAVGSEFAFDPPTTGTGFQVDAVLLGDGRVAIVWTDANDIKMTIVDTRDNANTIPVYSPDSHQVGTIGDDTFEADAAMNFGWDGNDTITDDNNSLNDIFGGNGDDMIIARNVNPEELFDGGSGNDTLVGDFNISDGSVYDLAAGTLTDGADVQQILNFENATGTASNETLRGTNGVNILNGLGGNDMLFGEGGADMMFGGTGFDTLRGGALRDRMNGEQGNDVLRGDAGSDIMRGGLGNDLMLGGIGADVMSGGFGNDTMFGEGGRDKMRGDAGSDVLRGGTGNDTLFGNGGNDTLFGGTGVDELNGNNGADILNGEGGFDTLRGGAGQDTLNGGNGDDTLLGQGGRDTLNGGAGNDALTGGNFNDTFVFAGNFGQDTITDFNPNAFGERIDLSGVGTIVNLNDLINNHISQVGADVVINDLAGNTITVENVTVAQMSQGSDYIF